MMVITEESRALTFISMFLFVFIIKYLVTS